MDKEKLMQPKILTVLRTYGGAEGVRVRKGSLLVVDDAAKAKELNCPNISRPRMKQLIEARLVSPADGEDVRSARIPANKMEPDSRPPVTAAGIRQSHRAVARAQPFPAAKSETPGAPRQVSGPRGGQTGQEKQPSSSQEGLAPETQTLRQRGTRKGSDGSPSTTRGDSASGPNTSTPATTGGGDNTTTNSSGQASEEVL